MVFAPLGLFFVGAAVEQAGHEVDFVDLNVDKLPEGYDAYLVTGTTPQLASMLEVPVSVKGLTIAGGPHATLRPGDLFTYDYVVQGEGEAVIPTLLNKEWPSWIVKTERLQDFPHPIRRWSHRYSYTLDGLPATHAMLSRGCPYKCGFCAHPLWENKVTNMPLEWCEEELDIIAKDYKGVMFYDDTFVLDKNRVAAIGEMLAKRKMTWRCFVRADRTDRETANLLAQHGCVEVGMGVESGSDEILRTIGKKTTYDKNAEAVAILREAGIRTKVFLIVGLPGESKETIEATKRWIREAKPYDFDIAIFAPYPGTPICDNPERYDIHWNGLEAEKMWYKGKAGKYESLVWTDSLSREDIVRHRDEIERMKKELR